MTALLYAATAPEIGVCVAASRLWLWGTEGPRPDRRDLPGGPWCWPAPG